ncbi:hypothetical protein K523DRAFT_85968 [Schizophyllum commune Tattone D]|nr:hypothetical protein K523DRAFT_85968 [Schizophyllum commune Tattone D]
MEVDERGAYTANMRATGREICPVTYRVPSRCAALTSRGRHQYVHTQKEKTSSASTSTTDYSQCSAEDDSSRVAGTDRRDSVRSHMISEAWVFLSLLFFRAPFCEPLSQSKDLALFDYAPFPPAR